ncbi:MAG: hypothetical protein IPL08_12685 [Saprospiraceae bacterium]|nr:hypothetical protein [Saprospiraceae bacterium]
MPQEFSFSGQCQINQFIWLFGIYEIPELISIVISIFTIIVIINAFNLVDGIGSLC